MHCVKLLGQRLMARDFDRQVAEFQVRVAVLNSYTAIATLIQIVALQRLASPSQKSWDRSVREKGKSDR